MRVAAIHLCSVNINKRRNPSLFFLVVGMRCHGFENGITQFVCVVLANNNNTSYEVSIQFLF